jgi:VWFA-related protein
MRCTLALAFATSLLSAASPAARGASATPASPQPLTHTVYVSATDRNGASVLDLTGSDFAVKEGGKAREVLQAGPATRPMKIAILIDDNGTGIFRYGVGRFMQRLQGRAEFALSTVAGQHLKIVDYTANGQVLGDALAQLVARPGTADGGQLLEGIYETARDLERRKTDRAVIVVLTVGGEEHSSLPAHHVLDQLRKSGAALHVVSVSSSALRSMAAVDRPSALLGENLNLNEVLGDGPKQSGGVRGEIVATAGLVAGLQQLAETLLTQYAVEYTRPEGAKADKLSVSVKRPGISVRAPVRVPDR